MQNNKSTTVSNEINERAQEVLRLLVDCYIREGQPVASKALAQISQLNISPASIRHIMADLEEAGFLCSPHTSAGRVPTVKGYRFFVDSLLNVKFSPTNLAIENWDEQLRNCADTKELITTASSMLSDITHLASLVMLPRRESAILRHIEFLPLSNNRVLIILVLQKHEVQNRIIYTDRCYSHHELQTIGSYLTTNFAGKELHEIRQLLLVMMQQEQNEINALAQIIIEITNQPFFNANTNTSTDYVIAGETNLFDINNQVAIEKLRDIFAAFATKRDIMHLLDRCLHADGIKIYIGDESGYAPLGDCSLVTTPYRENGKIVGVLGVIGPTRMKYDNAIAAVDITSKLLSAALGEFE